MVYCRYVSKRVREPSSGRTDGEGGSTMHYDQAHGHIVLTVGELCALSHKGGSLDARRPMSHMGAEADGGAGTLSLVSPFGGVTFAVSGRPAAVSDTPAGGAVVEVAKPLYALGLYRSSPRDEDMAEVSAYGYFLAIERSLPAVTLRLVYARSGEEEDAVCFESVMPVEHVRRAYLSMLEAILPRARDLAERETTVRDTAREAVFPYDDMRSEQKDMILECWRDLRAGKTLFAEAPTGIGKTIATLYPAVRCWGENRCDKIFYLTAKNATRREAFGAVGKLWEAGTPLRACVITARESMCLCAAAKSARAAGERLTAYCNPDACPYAKGYYDRVDGVISSLFGERQQVFGGMDIRRAAEAGRVCPYELSLDLSERCEIVICDYNYVFSPAVSLKRYFADGIPHSAGHRYIFLVDEAHNLPDRARDMYTGELSLASLRSVQDRIHAWETETRGNAVFPDEDLSDESSPRVPRLRAASLDDLMGVLGRYGHRCDETAVTGSDGVRRGAHLGKDEPVELAEEVRRLASLCDRWSRRNGRHPLTAVVEELTASLRGFRTASDYYDRAFATFTAVEGEDVRVRLCCLDPAGILRPLLQKAEARILFSATLTPAGYYADILGGGHDSVLVSFDSPFPTDRLCVALCDKVSTRHDDRETSYRRIVSYIAATVSAKRGNYMVYFPSYAYLDKVYTRFHKKYPQIKTVVQTPGMSYAEREAFIGAFRPDGQALQIGFCVLGGSFSEGVDLPGRCLIGALIVGVGIPGLSSERNIMRDYYDERLSANGDEVGSRVGYDYAYTYPGMNHILQAAGRVIRRPEDRGVVVLIDDRYTADPYLHLFPPHWKQIAAVGDAESLYEHLSRFWESGE